jgi:tRNA nucleotidyltransferase (CCA-adding enzyme)
MLQEDKVVLNMKRMQELHILQFIHPKLTFDDTTRTLFEKIKEVINWYELSFLEDAYEPWKIYFLGLLEGLHKSEIVSIFKRLSLSEKDQKGILHNREQLKNVLARMVRKRSLSSSELYHLLYPLSTECLIYLMARVTRREAKMALSTFLSQLKHVTIATTGTDLKKLGLKPGKLYKKILDNLLDARLDGKVRNKREEIAYVKEHLLS